MKQQLTVKEALERGYIHYGDDDASFMSEIFDIDEDDDFPHGVLLYNPTPEVMLNITKGVVAELLADWCATQVSETVSNEQTPDKVHEKIMGQDFSNTAEMINALFEKQTYYRLTDIELIP
jgi:hypothetical protein